MQAIPHLHFKGNCSEACGFYARTLGDRIAFAMAYGESPAAAQAPTEARNQIHARLEPGTVTLSFQETFWARCFGMCTDRFGIVSETGGNPPSRG
jgi:PhnB protein